MNKKLSKTQIINNYCYIILLKVIDSLFIKKNQKLKKFL